MNSDERLAQCPESTRNKTEKPLSDLTAEMLKEWDRKFYGMLEKANRDFYEMLEQRFGELDSETKESFERRNEYYRQRAGITDSE